MQSCVNCQHGYCFRPSYNFSSELFSHKSQIVGKFISPHMADWATDPSSIITTEYEWRRNTNIHILIRRQHQSASHDTTKNKYLYS